MATTPINNWPIPEDTDLVKDGAKAIRDLGNAIDTSSADFAGGLVHINTTSFSAVSSQSFNNVFSASFKHYIVKMYMNSSSAEVSISARLRVGGTDATAGSSYLRQRNLQLGTTNFSASSTSDAWGIGLISTPAALFPASMTLSRPFEAVMTGASGDMGFQAGSQLWHGYHNQENSYDGFTIYPSTGTISGEVSIYGLAQ